MLCITGCEKWMDEHIGKQYYGFNNNADYGISLYSLVISPNYTNPVIYPDTTLPYQEPRWIIDINPMNEMGIYEGHSSMQEYYADYNTDTMSLFVISTYTLKKDGWDFVRDSYDILQRYDIGVNEFNHTLSFPPSEEMRDIKMWPPYGTYDENGHRIEQ